MLRNAIATILLAAMLPLLGCAAGPPPVPMAVACPSLPAVPKALMQPPENSYLLRNTESLKPAPTTTPFASLDCRNG